mmetsp:Transcript_27838/g.32108  ORF Transcript_27838/g.32108 Transcript_27838/m.32108 type:complete len:88 (+) Transcript_27838:850-1113(+)
MRDCNPKDFTNIELSCVSQKTSQILSTKNVSPILSGPSSRIGFRNIPQNHTQRAYTIFSSVSKGLCHHAGYFGYRKEGGKVMRDEER